MNFYNPVVIKFMFAGRNLLLLLFVLLLLLLLFDDNDFYEYKFLNLFNFYPLNILGFNFLLST